jgi:hypothetical protein
VAHEKDAGGHDRLLRKRGDPDYRANSFDPRTQEEVVGKLIGILRGGPAGTASGHVIMRRDVI